MTEDYSAFCECDIDGYWSFYSSQRRKAKREHRCDECRATIQPGEIYEYAAGKQEGEMWSSKTCAACLELIDFIRAHVPCYCRIYGDLFGDRLRDIVDQAGQTPGFAFGILRRVVAVNRNKETRNRP